MGIEITRERFEAADHARFAARLGDQLAALRAVLARPGFGEGPATLGSELEVSLVDGAGRPLGVNRAVLASTLDPRVTLEVDRFNLELNTRPCALAGAPFAALARELEDGLAELRRAAGTYGGRVATIGILPTLTPEDLGSAALTDSARFRALSAAIRGLRHEPFPIRIGGDDPLELDADDVTLQGANTSFQIHLRVAPAEFARAYNAAQIATGAVLAAAGNSPLFLGHRLWEETRVAVFRQSVDERVDAEPDDWRAARVSFGHGWVRRGAYELFAESVALHPIFLPMCAEDFPVSAGVPSLLELRLHHGTVWRWNRAVYDDAGGGHLRIEMRALPCGPTVADMAANAAFLVGLTLGLAPHVDELLPRFTFGHARRNFYAAARDGLAAELLWPSERIPSPEPHGAAALVASLLPLARTGLVDNGVSAAEADAQLAVIAARVAKGATGARWQRQALERLGAGRARPAALAALLERYLAAVATGRPVHEWEV
ncbi:MAG TPA: glutamate-cysteine ligase family protein [Candidatus Binatia bacterium]|jgi:gamma-glutamyl:cysteine ligase YbdK (ATP-grasp superfamily)